MRCASHTLSLIDTTDIRNIKDNIYNKYYKRLMSKCSALWNMSGRPKYAEVIKDCIGYELK